MTQTTSILVLISLLLMGLLMIAHGQRSSEYKYLFRNTILSKSKKYEIGAVLRGRVYYPRYFYIPSSKQYLVYSSVDDTGSFRHESKSTVRDGKTHVLLNESGTIEHSLETSLRFSCRSGCFFGTTHFIPWLETGKSDIVSYHQIYNANQDFNRQSFEKTYQELYKKAEYVEFINLRGIDGDKYDAAVIFKIEGKVEILLSGLHKSHMTNYFQEDRTTNNIDDYYLPNISNGDAYPQSVPTIEMIQLETKDTNPFIYFRHWFKKPFRIVKYQKTYSSGWNGLGSLHGVPIYVPGEHGGTTYARFKAKGEVFKIKLLDVLKTSFLPVYNLGLRIFEVPEKYLTSNSLVFIESVQNCGDNRLGGGVFVVRQSTSINSSADIPAGITEKQFSILPLYLQEALMDPENATELTIEDSNILKWIPEIEYLKNLKSLTFNTAITNVPNEISKLQTLEKLTMQGGKIAQVSPQLAELKSLKYLDFSRNPLNEFPKVILELNNLEHLNLNFTSIPSLPLAFSRLENLKHLDIIETQIKILPESMIGMQKLYIYDGGVLENQVPPTYKHLFGYMKHLK
jgi:Leucine-rich repeat (LRR) protein